MVTEKREGKGLGGGGVEGVGVIRGADMPTARDSGRGYAVVDLKRQVLALK